MTAPRNGPPSARRVLVLLAAVAAIGVCGSGIGAAEPTVTPAPAPPTPTTAAPATPVVPTSPSVPAPMQPGQQPAAPSDSTGADNSGSDCGVTHIADCVATAIDGFFHRLVDSALNPLLELLSQTMLTTPDPADLPRIGQLWSSSWQLVLAMYGLVIIAAGILLMVHQTLQTRWGWRELLPRLVGGFVAGAMSMTVATVAIRFANGLASALAEDGVSADSASAALQSMIHVGAGTATNLFITLLLCALSTVMSILMITYVIRVAITVVLIVAAPIAMMCYALPATESVARWWWRSMSACLAIQIVQSMVLITGLRVFLSPGGWWFFGPTKSGLVSVIVALAMGLILAKVPFWLLSAMKISSGRSVVGTVARGVIMYKTFGLARTGGKALGRALHPGPVPKLTPRPRPDPYAKVSATDEGQLMLGPRPFP